MQSTLKMTFPMKKIQIAVFFCACMVVKKKQILKIDVNNAKMVI